VPASRTRPQSAATQVASFIAKFDPAIARLVRQARSKLRTRYPTAFELVYDNYNALAIGYGPNERASEVFVSLAAFARGVNLYFIQGRKVADPKHLLQGEANQGRYVRLERADRIDDPEIVALLTSAVGLGKTPLPSTAKGKTIVKSISAAQRPRRLPPKSRTSSR
jgi:hypothetical protein